MILHLPNLLRFKKTLFSFIKKFQKKLNKQFFLINHFIIFFHEFKQDPNKSFLINLFHYYYFKILAIINYLYN